MFRFPRVMANRSSSGRPGRQGLVHDAGDEHHRCVRPGRLRPSDSGRSRLRRRALGILPSTPAGKIWFTEHYVNKIGVLQIHVAQTFQEVSTPATNSNPYGITVDAANNVWFTENTDSVATHRRVHQSGNPEGVQDPERLDRGHRAHAASHHR